jgi:hypothetical protein
MKAAQATGQLFDATKVAGPARPLANFAIISV